MLLCTAHAIEGREVMFDNLQWMIMHWEFRFRLLWYFMYCLRKSDDIGESPCLRMVLDTSFYYFHIQDARSIK